MKFVKFFKLKVLILFSIIVPSQYLMLSGEIEEYKNNIPQSSDIISEDCGIFLDYTPYTLSKIIENGMDKDHLGVMQISYDDKSFYRFCEYMGFKESSNDYKVVNTLGYKGKYQLGRMSLEDLNIYGREDFLKNTKLQDSAFISLVSINKHRLRKYIMVYENRTLNGIKITESGILAAAHLVGSESVKTYLKSGLVTSDANGTSVENYLEDFKGFKITVDAERTVDLKNYHLN